MTLRGSLPSASGALAGAALGLAVIAGCGGGGGNAGPACGRPYLTSVARGGAAGVGVVGGGVGIWVGDPGYGTGGWYDPGDDYVPGDPAPPDGWDNQEGDNPYDDGSGDVATGDPNGDPGASADNGAADTASGDGTGTAAMSKGRLRLASASVTSAAATTVTSPDANGCYACTVGCVAGTGATATGRQAVGTSSISYDHACRIAVYTLEYWAHTEHTAKVQTCQTIDTTVVAGPDAGGRTPAIPTAAPAPTSPASPVLTPAR